MSEEVLWERTLHQRLHPCTVAVAGDCVVAHERQSRLVCLDWRDGTLRWDVPFGLWPRSVVAAGDHCLGIAQNTDVLTCWDLRTGAVLWKADLPRLAGHIVVGDDTVIVGGWRGYTPLHAFDLSTGRLLWSTGERHDTVRPLVVGDAVLMGEGRGASVRLIRMRDGWERARWELPEPLTAADAGMLFSWAGADRVLARCGQSTVVEIRIGGGTIRTLRCHDRALAPTAVQCAGGLLWLREPTGYAVADLAEGALRWRIDLRQRPAEGVIPAGAGFLIGGDQGALFHIDSTGRIIKRSAVSRHIAELCSTGPDNSPDALIVATRGTLLALRIAADDTSRGPLHDDGPHHRWVRSGGSPGLL
ncbi:PQQ-binding-like beta-propeller repeat protein [Streptomyces kronopolitis]|uniref:outer membrane protein assembly factor BamB family protein n=1 Tax=Streptomyces kronopolitis TaxID=1612435 RepID=UPI003D95C2B3